MIPAQITRDHYANKTPCVNFSLGIAITKTSLLNGTCVDIPICCLILIMRWDNEVISNWKETSCISLVRPGPLVTKRTEILPQDLVKYRSREIHLQTFPIALKFDRQRCWDACQFLERYDHYNAQSRDFETSRDLTLRRPFAFARFTPNSRGTWDWLTTKKWRNSWSIGSWSARSYVPPMLLTRRS